MEIYFVFFFPPQKKKKPHPHCTHWQSLTSQRSSQSFAKECNHPSPPITIMVRFPISCQLWKKIKSLNC